jgi:N-acetylglucosamine-6-phosphate deacetylase
LPVSDLLATARQVGLVADAAESVPAACEIAIRHAGEEGLVVVTGSLYVVGEARSIFVAPPVDATEADIGAMNGAGSIPELDGRVPHR